jgi:hypothetical protein
MTKCLQTVTVTVQLTFCSPAPNGPIEITVEPVAMRCSRLLAAYWSSCTTCRMADNVHGQPRDSFLTLSNDTSTGPRTSHNLYLKNRRVRQPSALTNDNFVTSLRTSRKINLAYLKLGNVRFSSYPLNYLTFQANLCERLKTVE